MTDAPLSRRSTASPALDLSIAPGFAEPAPTILSAFGPSLHLERRAALSAIGGLN